MRHASDADPRAHARPPAGRLAALFLDRCPLLDGLSWRLIGLTTLVALPFLSFNVLKAARTLNWGGTLYSVLGTLLEGICVLVLAIVFVNLRRRALPRPVALALGVALGSLLAATLYELPSLFIIVERMRPDTGWFFGNVVWAARRSAMTWAFLAAAWYFLQRIAERRAALQEAELSRQQLEVRTVEARLQAMQAQTEPHFLFNTLSHVKRLYRTDPALGRAMLDRFCDYLRATLPQMRGEGATLGRELDLACAYLDVQRVRMGKRLAVAVDVPADLRNLPFPSMMLLTIVENAVKHGLSPLPDGGAITISAQRRGESLKVSVADTGRGFSDTKGAGVGLSNIRARLASLHGSAAALTLAPGAPRGIIAAITLPTAAPAARPALLAGGGDAVERADVPPAVAA